MRMWEIRENESSRYGRRGGTSSASGMRSYKSDLYEEGYECGFEEGYEKAMKEMEHSYDERRMY